MKKRKSWFLEVPGLKVLPLGLFYFRTEQALEGGSWNSQEVIGQEVGENGERSRTIVINWHIFCFTGSGKHFWKPLLFKIQVDEISVTLLVYCCEVLVTFWRNAQQFLCQQTQIQKVIHYMYKLMVVLMAVCSVNILMIRFLTRYLFLITHSPSMIIRN